MTCNLKPASVPHMSPELIAILAVGATLAGIMLTGLRDMRRDLSSRFDGLDERLRSVEAGLAEVKGQLTIVRDYIAGRNTRSGDRPAAPAE